jgi:hypothetical protein
MAAVFLIGSFVLGIAITKRLFPFTNSVERIFWGIVLGSMFSTWAAYALSRFISDLKYPAIAALTIVIGGLAAFFLYQDLASLRRFIVQRNWFREHWSLILLFALFAPIFFYFFYVGMFHRKEGVLYLTLTSWYDMALHLAVANSFVYGHNFPPAYLLLPGEPLRYPFLPDFHAAILLKLGWSLWPCFAISSFVMAISLVGVFFCFARRLLDSQIASAIATLLFFFNGGLGFILFWRDWRQSHETFFVHLLNMKENYTDWWSEGLKWANLITSGIIPQRAMLYGMPIALIVLTLIAVVWRQWSESDVEKRWDGFRILFPAGIITGLLPLFHVHSYVAIGFVTCGLFLIRPRFVWLAFWIPALLLAVPSLFDIGTHVTSGESLRFHLGWMSYLGPNWWLFFIRNFGLALLLVLLALAGGVPTYLRTFYIPFAALIVFCFFFVVSANHFDNLKFIYYGYSVTTVIIARWLWRLAQRPKLRAIVVLILFCSTASGALAIIREAKLVHGIFVHEEIEAGKFARSKLPPKALFLTGQYHNQPVLCLAGKPIVLGYDFWITSHGYTRDQFDAIKNDVKAMYRGGPGATILLEKYGVDYIYIGPKERADFTPNTHYFDDNYTVVFRNKDITIYDAGNR